MGSKTIIWNGPMGVFEMGKFESGTKSMMDSVVSVTPMPRIYSISSVKCSIRKHVTLSQKVRLRAF